MKTKQTTDDPILALDAADLASVHGGLFGPLAPLIGRLNQVNERDVVCEQAAHWKDNYEGKNNPSYKGDPGVKAWADMKALECTNARSRLGRLPF
jgi:hypothetical protein